MFSTANLAAKPKASCFAPPFAAKTKKPFPLGWVWGWGGGGGSIRITDACSDRKRGTVSGWREMETNLNINEYAKQVCKEIGWPFAGNLTLLCDCISSLGHMKGLGVWGGFFNLMEAVEHAKRQGVRVDRWFFQDGKYAELDIKHELAPNSDPPPKPPSPAVAMPPKIAAENEALLRRANVSRKAN